MDKIEQLARAKVQLAERLVAIMTRTCGRLDYDLNRIRIASGEAPIPLEPPVASLAASSKVPDKLVESIRAAIPIPEQAPSPPPTIITTPAFKRKCLTFNVVQILSTPSLGSLGRRPLGGPMNGGIVNNIPVVLSQPGSAGLPPRPSRLSNTISVRPSPPLQSSRRATITRAAQPANNGEGEPDESAEDPAGGDDETIYCFCRKLSYGEVSSLFDLLRLFLRLDRITGWGDLSRSPHADLQGEKPSVVASPRLNPSGKICILSSLGAVLLSRSLLPR